MNSDISACDRRVCSDHQDDNDYVGFKVVVITCSGLTLFRTHKAPICVMLYGALENSVLLIPICAYFLICGGVVGFVVSVALEPYRYIISSELKVFLFKW